MSKGHRNALINRIVVFIFDIGAHSDIGGGSHANTEPGSLSFVPLRWMIKECLIAGTGILFEADVLSKFEFDFHALEKHLGGPAMVQLGLADRVGKSSVEDPTVAHSDTDISSSPDPPEPSISSLLLSRLYDKIKPTIREKYGTYFNSLTNFFRLRYYFSNHRRLQLEGYGFPLRYI